MTEIEKNDLSDLYRARFSDRDLRSKSALWATLCSTMFQQYVPVTGTVLDLGAGGCEFINNIRAERRIAVDLNPDTADCAEEGVEVLLTSANALDAVDDDSVDTVFTSNFFEHLPDKDTLMDTLRECHRVLAPGGRIVVLMPNIRYLAGRYWDFFDHHLPLTHLSLVEALSLAKFEPERVVPRFLPYTVKDARLPVKPVMVQAYLAARPLWPLLGRQMLVVARAS